MITDTTVLAAVIGAAGTALGVVIKSLYSRNQNKKDQQDHEENLLKISMSMNGVGQAIENLRGSVNDRLDLMEGSLKDLGIRVKDINDKVDKFHSEQKEVNQALLRHDITATYEAFKDKEEIPKIIYESTMSLHDQYKISGGNSFVDEEIEEMKKWKKV